MTFTSNFWFVLCSWKVCLAECSFVWNPKNWCSWRKLPFPCLNENNPCLNENFFRKSAFVLDLKHLSQRQFRFPKDLGYVVYFIHIWLVFSVDKRTYTPHSCCSRWPAFSVSSCCKSMDLRNFKKTRYSTDHSMQFYSQQTWRIERWAANMYGSWRIIWM